jgi:uncharacterized membrane protein YeaQ/YmgE (transglycosylase-associated protein family)
MDGTQLAELLHRLCQDALMWIGFGTLVGLVARAIMPGKDPGGAISTLLMGIVGVVLGCGTISFFLNSRITPVSPLGFAVATVGAVVLLAVFRVLRGSMLNDGIVLFTTRRRRQKIKVAAADL